MAMFPTIRPFRRTAMAASLGHAPVFQHPGVQASAQKVVLAVGFIVLSRRGTRAGLGGEAASRPEAALGEL
jgi:hypothetical protein